MPLTPHPGLKSPTPPTPINPAPFSRQQPPRPGAYSSVNQLSLLPDEMRTVDNLEGGTLPTGELEEDLLVKYRKERDDYEKRQLLKMTELKAKRDMAKESQAMTTPPQAGPEAPRETAHSHRVDPYEFPTDAVSHGGKGKVGVVAGKKAATPPGLAKLTVGVEDVGEGYTSVFNILPAGHVGKVPLHQPPRTTRASSLSNPPSPLTSPQAAAGGGAAGGSGAAGMYENSPGPSPSEQATGNDTHPPSGKSSVRQDGKEVVHINRNRQSKRKAKEVVEFDPNKPKKFHVTAGKQADGADQVDGSSQREEGLGEVITPTHNFSVQGEGPGQQSYALVNMDDKKTRRVGSSDSGKVEGSGIPLHYRVAIPSS